MRRGASVPALAVVELAPLPMVLEPAPVVADVPVPAAPVARGALVAPMPVLAGLGGVGLVFAGFGVEPVLVAPLPPGAGVCAIGAAHHKPASTAVNATIFVWFMRVSNKWLAM
jgi:hypothetical protein